MFKRLKPLALAVVATLALTGATEAGYGGIKQKTASFKVLDSVMHHTTTMVFAPKNGKYEFKEMQGGPLQVHLKAEKARRAWISRYYIALGSSMGLKLIDTGWGDLKDEKVDKSFSFNLTRQMLKSIETEGRNFCNRKGNPNETVLEKTSIKVFARVESGGNNIAMTTNSLDSYTANRYAPIYIACMPEPFEVTDVQLSVKYEGNSRNCPVNATLQAKFKTNKAEKKQFTFVLVRDNGMKQEVTKYAYPEGNGGVATWQKKYTFTKTESRKYMIYVKGHKATAMWVPVGANCSSGPAGGFSNGPIPTN